MSEVINQTNSPEQAVFGDAFSFNSGIAEAVVVGAFFQRRVIAIKDGSKAWLPRVLDADSGVSADLFKDGRVAATLNFEYESRSASVYVTSPGGSFGDTTLCERVTFAEAVTAAEQAVS